MFDLVTEKEVARLTLRRPAARNAIPTAGWDALAAKAREAEEGGARILLLAGEGVAFSAGADLGEFASLHGDEAAAGAFREAMRHGIEAVAALSIPTIALVEGACFGAAVALIMACDIRLAGPEARFAITPAKIGISYPQEDVFRLVGLVGKGQASRLLLSGATIGADEAMRIGLVEGEAVDLDAITEALRSNSAASLKTLKRGIALAAAGLGCDAEQDRTFDRLLASDAAAARLAARRAG